MGVYLFSKNKVCLFNKNHILLFRESTFVPTPMQNQTHIVIFCCYWAILWSFNALIWGSYCLKVKIVFDQNRTIFLSYLSLALQLVGQVNTIYEEEPAFYTASLLVPYRGHSFKKTKKEPDIYCPKKYSESPHKTVHPVAGGAVWCTVWATVDVVHTPTVSRKT